MPRAPQRLFRNQPPFHMAKHDAPVLTDTVENRTHHYLRHRALQTPGVIVHEVGGAANHIRLAAGIPPTLVIADWIGELKGAREAR